MLSLNEKFTILFIGDSITDCGRSRENPEITGSGYPYRHENKYWAPDGVHPSPQGHALIASSWREFAGI